MPRIPSANPDFDAVQPLGTETGYRHPAESRTQGIPMAFQVTNPFNRLQVLLPHSLVMHVNPSSLQESFAKKVERIMTRGGWVEQHWPDDLLTISADASTGAFINIHTGLSSVLRQRTIAYDRFQDLRDLYRNNGAIYDPQGNIVFQGDVMLMYDRGIYLGKFRSFKVSEEEGSPFAFKMSWEFKVEHTIQMIALARPTSVRTPGFQSTNFSG